MSDLLHVGNGGFELLGGFTPGDWPFSNYNATTFDNFSGLTFLVILAEANPLAEGLGAVYLHQWNVGVAGQSLNKLLVVILIDIVGEEGTDGFSLLKGSSNLVEAFGGFSLGTGSLQ